MSRHGYDGPTLRAVRESAGVPLRKLAREASISHGHLSKVERGEPGRPVTQALLDAYEKVTGIRLTGIAGHRSTATEDGWRRGHLSESRRKVLRAKIAAVAAGGVLSERADRLLDSTGRLMARHVVEELDVVQLEQVAALAAKLDMRYGGGVADQLARAQLKWAVLMLDSEASATDEPRLQSAVAALAQRAGWAAFDADSHEVARSLLTVGLYTATQADDADLRAHIIADFAAQANFLGYPDDCLYIVRHAEVDERVGPHVRMVVYGVKARAYALQGNEQACRQQLVLAERSHAEARCEPVEGWRHAVATTAHLHASAGHALATLARRADSVATREEAQVRLRAAVERFDPTDQARTAALCLAQLTALHLEAGELDRAVDQGQRLVRTAGEIRSNRLAEHLAVVRKAASPHEHDMTVKELAAELDARLAIAAEDSWP